MTELDPPGPELLAKNRRLLAQREHWPDGALQGCEQVDADHPGWATWWRRADGWTPAAGFYAQRHGETGPRYPRPYGATPDELGAAIDAAPQRFW